MFFAHIDAADRGTFWAMKIHIDMQNFTLIEKKSQSINNSIMIIMYPSIRMYYWRAALLQIEIVTQKISFWLRNPQLAWFLKYINNKMNWCGFG